MWASGIAKWFPVLLLSIAWQTAAGSQQMAQVAAEFLEPPDDARVMMRWWWFGPAVSRAELQREVRAMKAGGFGGFEIQPVYPLVLDDPSSGLRNLPYLSDEFIDALRFAAEQGRAEQLRVDLTLGSGWPFGGPHVPITQAAAQIRMIKLAVPSEDSSAPTPLVGSGEKLLAVFIADGAPDAIDTRTLRMLPLPSGSRMTVPSREQRSPAAAKGLDRTLLFFMQSRTGQQVKRPSIGGEGFVLDHMNRAAIDNHLRVVGDRLLSAFADRPPDAVFSDSLEVYRAEWTDDLLDEFRRRRGYDLLPHLPALFFDGDAAADIRHDWGRTLSELVDERYLAPINAWAESKRTRFRSQTYGFPPVTLSSNALVALPEGEGNRWRGFSTTRWASSASHLYDRPVTSVEAWTWLHSPAFRATPLDMKAEADVLFLQGATQLIGHGWPYTPPSVPAPGWSLYAAAVFSDQNPWWLAMPDIARYLQRVSYLLRQGEPVNDVAILLPTHDAWASTVPGRATVSDEMRRYVTDELTEQLLDAGYAFDYIDAAAIEEGKLRYRVLVLPRVTRIAPDTYRRIEQYARSGGIVIAVGQPPALGAGYLNADAQRSEVQSISQALFGEAARRARVVQEAQLGVTLRELLEPDLQLVSPNPAIGFVHRRLADADIYFIANTGPHPVKTAARFRDARDRVAHWWNLVTGAREAAMGVGGSYVLELSPYESRVLVFGGTGDLAADPATSAVPRKLVADLSKEWNVRFEPLGITRRAKTLTSWTEDEATRYYSGVAIYRRNVTVPRSFIRENTGQRLILNFGEGTPVVPDEKQRGSRAWLESPVREAAEVYINGERTGSIWAPPYELDVTRWLRAGTNRLELRVGNLAINTLAGRAPADYRLLNARYGERFVPQDMENLQPLPAGVLGSVVLQARAAGVRVPPGAAERFSMRVLSGELRDPTIRNRPNAR